MSFFRQFPLTSYDLQKTGLRTRITDLFRNVTARQVKLDPTISYTDYRIVNGERPDVVSQLIYGDPDYYWTFFIINDALKAGHRAWPMSQGQLESYLAQEYDGYSVIQMCDQDSHTITVNDEVLSTTVSTEAGGDLDFASNPQNIVDLASSTSRSVMKYDPYMQQIWINNTGESDTFTTTLQTSGKFQFSKYSSSPYTLSTLTINGSTYDQFYPISYDIGQKIASPGVLSYVKLGRNAIHHYVFSPVIGDEISIGYYAFDTSIQKTVFRGINGRVVDLIEAKVNSYGGIVVDPGNGNLQYHYFTDPQGFLLTAQDVNAILIGSTINSNQSFVISPTNRITGVTYAEWEIALNEQRSSIRVINPQYIQSFVKQYRDLLNA